MPDPSKKERPVTSGPNQVFSNAGANIDEFTYAREGARLEFQANITCLWDVHAELYARLQSAEGKGKQGIFLTSTEVEIFKEQIMHTASQLLIIYERQDSTLKITNKLYKACSRIHLKDLAA